MTSAPVPLAEKIAVINRVMMRPRGMPSPHRDFYEEARDEREATVLIAAIATLQKHECAMAALRQARNYMSRRDVRTVARFTGIDIDAILGDSNVK